MYLFMSKSTHILTLIEMFIINTKKSWRNTCKNSEISNFDLLRVLAYGYSIGRNTEIVIENIFTMLAQYQWFVLNEEMFCETVTAKYYMEDIEE